MLHRVIEPLHHEVFAHQRRNNFLVMPEPSQHVQSQLESGFIACVLNIVFGTELHKDARKFETVAEHVKLQHLVELTELPRLQQEA